MADLDIYRTANEDHLCQGDILVPDDLRGSLEGHQDYFANTAHFHRFVVLTQTCDLAREKDRCNFIFLSVARKMSEALGRRNFETRRDSDSAMQLVNDLLNFRYNKRGFFYLPENREQGIDEQLVIDLRVIFSIHKSHHDVLLTSRCGGLADIFAVQLGQLTAQMFNRVALPDIDGAAVNQERVKIIGQAKENEEKRFQSLLSDSTHKKCSISFCKSDAKTYRWMRVRSSDQEFEEQEKVLCIEHAKQLDNGTLSLERTLRER